VASALGLRVKFKGTTLQEFAQRYKPDLSPTGIFVRTDTPLAVGSRVHFTFSLENDTPLLDGEAVVVWVAEENKELSIPSGMELRFDALSPDAQDRFHWLQMEKRGVTVGRELPVSVSTSSPLTSSPVSSSADGAASAAADAEPERADPPRADPPRVEPASVSAAASPDVSDEDPSDVDAITDELPPKRQTLPLGSKTPGGPAGLDPARAQEPLSARSTQPYVPSKAPLALRRPPVEELGPGDSDPAKLFHAVATRSDPAIPLREERDRIARTTRPFLWGIGVGVLLLLGWVGYLTTRPRPSSPARDLTVPRPVQARALRVVSEPAGAEVLLDGQLVGTTPLVVQLKGTERVLVRRAGHIAEGLVLSTDSPAWKLEGQRLVLPLDLKLQRAPHTPATVAPDAAPALSKSSRPHVSRRRARDPQVRAPEPARPPDAGAAQAPQDASAPDATPDSLPATAPAPVKDPPQPAGKIRKPSWTD
jgi:uncharacterized protein (TIGR02266 family)